MLDSMLDIIYFDKVFISMHKMTFLVVTKQSVSYARRKSNAGINNYLIISIKSACHF